MIGGHDRAERTETILRAAWRIAERDEIGALTLRGLARDLGVSQPSLYEYFDSKHALFDALFADGNRQLLARLDAVALPEDHRAACKLLMRAFVDFALESEPRQQLMFHRPIAGFVPTDASYSIAAQAYERAVSVLRAAGMTSQEDIDCLVAQVAGLIAAQASNEPGGDRWTRHLERMVDLHLDHAIGIHPPSHPETGEPT